MRMRRVDANGDMRFGHSRSDYWRDEPEGVGLLVTERLMLFQGEWFADTTQGTPWATEVLGERTQATRDLILRDRVLTTDGVLDIARYGSAFDPNTREWAAAMTIDTLFGAVALASPRLPGALPALPPPGASGLGVEGAGGTGVAATPADLTAGPLVNITAFSIRRLNAGEYP